MRCFVRDVVVFAGVNFLILGYLFAIYDLPNSYLGSINDKLNLVEEQSPTVDPNKVVDSNIVDSRSASPNKLLLIGGSSVGWNTHSEIIRSEIELQPVNMGYHAAVGLGMRIEEARQLARPGDVVVMSIEWSVFRDEPWNRKMTEVALAAPSVIRFMSLRDRKLVLDGLLPAMRIPFVAFVSDAKANGLAAFTHASSQRRRSHQLRSSFNEFGDYTGHYKLSRVGIEGKIIRQPTMSEVQLGVKRLNALHEELSRRNVQMFYFVPTIPTSRYEQDRTLLDSFVTELNNSLDFAVLNPNRFTQPDRDFFDSCYHLHESGGRARTQLLTKRLKAHLQVANGAVILQPE